MRAKGNPGALRIRLGRIMSERREMARMSQKDAARLINSTQSKISNIETASVDRINLTDLTTLCAAYGMSEAEANEVLGYARVPYCGGGTWFEAPVNVPARSELEQASVIKSFHLQAFDGLVQCPEYVRLQMSLNDSGSYEQRAESRLERQARILGRPQPPWCVFIMDEACFHKTMGRPDVLVLQIEHLVRLHEESLAGARNLQFHVVLSGAPVEAVVHDLTLYHLDNPSTATLATVEYGIGTTVVEDPVNLRQFESSWNRLLKGSLPDSDTIPFMLDMIAHHRKSME